MNEPAGLARSGADAEVLVSGQIEIEGRIMTASNATLLATATLGGASRRCVYKPVSGERPLWDFPDGTLARREVSAYAVSEALGWSVVPHTVLRDGPAGAGMVQQWQEPDPAQHPVDLARPDEVPPRMLAVVEAVDGRDRPIVLVHEDTAALRRMAVFDVLVNNADRKGGHVLAMPDGHRYGVDHGVCFHTDAKLRTVLWGWAGEPLTDAETGAVAALAERVGSPGGPLRARLDELLAPDEVAALAGRCEALLRAGELPFPSGGWPPIPWPAF